tara:strand:- start:1501 stop:2679 length:1179 start_codon:yes stop_codon:yes gene_type:complete
MKKILFLSFYFKPDLSAGSFRNTPLADELSKIGLKKNIEIDVYTTLPNRYNEFNIKASETERNDNLNIYRIKIPKHRNNMFDQIISFSYYYYKVSKLVKNKPYDLVYASSGRLFTAFLGYKLSKKIKCNLFLDIRDIFTDTLQHVLRSEIIKVPVMYFLNYIEKITFENARHINLNSLGFKEYFKKYKKPNFSYYPNGIDENFLSNKKENFIKKNNNKKRIIYAGNIGFGQGLDKIVPYAAKKLQKDYEFIIIGDGGAKTLLVEKIKKLQLNNVFIERPVMRDKLLKAYNNADILFIHLNNYDSFLKVLPSKIFELSCINKPILAGVSGFAKKFLNNEVSDSYVFNPCSVEGLLNSIKLIDLKKKIDRLSFKKKYNRKNITKGLAKSIINYI